MLNQHDSSDLGLIFNVQFNYLKVKEQSFYFFSFTLKLVRWTVTLQLCSQCLTNKYYMWYLSFFKIHVLFQFNERGCRGSDRMVVGFTTTYAISACHHWCCGFNCRSERGVIKFVSDFRQVGFLRVLRFPLPRYNWNIVESGVKPHKTKPNRSNLMTIWLHVYL
jgi:hypothetical protein